MDAAPGNTTLRLADRLNVFDAGAFGNGITVDRVTYKLLTVGTVAKYRASFCKAGGYYRRLDNFMASGKMPVGVVGDTELYVQLSHMIVPRKIELYGTTSYVVSKYGHPKEFIFGGNYYRGIRETCA